MEGQAGNGKGLLVQDVVVESTLRLEVFRYRPRSSGLASIFLLYVRIVEHEVFSFILEFYGWEGKDKGAGIARCSLDFSIMI